MEGGAVTIIRNCGLFCGLNEASFGKIAKITRTVRFKRGQTVFREGDSCPGIYLIGEGARPLSHPANHARNAQTPARYSTYPCRARVEGKSRPSLLGCSRQRRLCVCPTPPKLNPRGILRAHARWVANGIVSRNHAQAARAPSTTAKLDPALKRASGIGVYVWSW